MNSGHDAVLLDNTTEPFRRRQKETKEGCET
jgi:hypothetical protein